MVVIISICFWWCGLALLLLFSNHLVSGLIRVHPCGPLRTLYFPYGCEISSSFPRLITGVAVSCGYGISMFPPDFSYIQSIRVASVLHSCVKP